MPKIQGLDHVTDVQPMEACYKYKVCIPQKSRFWPMLQVLNLQQYAKI